MEAKRARSEEEEAKKFGRGDHIILAKDLVDGAKVSFPSVSLGIFTVTVNDDEIDDGQGHRYQMTVRHSKDHCKWYYQVYLWVSKDGSTAVLKVYSPPYLRTLGAAAIWDEFGLPQALMAVVGPRIPATVGELFLVFPTGSEGGQMYVGSRHAGGKPDGCGPMVMGILTKAEYEVDTYLSWLPQGMSDVAYGLHKENGQLKTIKDLVVELGLEFKNGHYVMGDCPDACNTTLLFGRN